MLLLFVLLVCFESRSLESIFPKFLRSVVVNSERSLLVPFESMNDEGQCVPSCIPPLVFTSLLLSGHIVLKEL